MKRIPLIFLFLSFILILSNCRKDEVLSEFNIPSNIIKSSITGTVISGLGNSVDGAIVSIGTSMTQTDKYGVFTFRDIEMDEYGTMVKIVKNGYFDVSKVFHPTLDNMGFIKFHLISKELSGSFHSSDEATIINNDQSSISFGRFSFQNTDGEFYIGKVNVYSKWLDPLDPNTLHMMPGDLRGIDGDHELVQLATYGMMAVEIESDSGEKLELMEGRKAEIEFPINSEITSQAPSIIPVWTYNEDSGFWMQETTAIKEGQKYVASVDHFSFWNCDAPFPLIEIEGTVLDNFGNPMPSVGIKIEHQGIPSSGYGQTNEEGFFKGKIPKDELLELFVVAECGTKLDSILIGPYRNNTTLEPIAMSFDSDDHVATIKGNLTDCNDTEISNGYIIVSFGERKIIVNIDANGYFNTTASFCSTSRITITGIDQENLFQSETKYIQLEEINTEINLNNLKACDLEEEYFRYTFDNGETYSLPFVYTSAFAPFYYIGAGFEPADSLDIPSFIELYTSGSGTIESDIFVIRLTDFNNQNAKYSSFFDNAFLNISELGAIGEPIIGNFSGTFEGNNNNSIEVVGEFRVLRDI